MGLSLIYYHSDLFGLMKNILKIYYLLKLITEIITFTLVSVVSKIA